MNIEELNRILRATCAPYVILSAAGATAGIGLNGSFGETPTTITNPWSFRWIIGSHAPCRIVLRCFAIVHIKGVLNGSAKVCSGVKLEIDGRPVGSLWRPYDEGDEIQLGPGDHVLESFCIGSTRDCHVVWGLSMLAGHGFKRPVFGTSVCSHINVGLQTRNFTEWIEYHLGIGIEHFFLFADHGCKLELFEGLSNFLKVVSVSMLPESYPSQTDAVHDLAIREIGPMSKWIAFIGIDEFLAIRSGSQLGDFLRPYEEFGGLRVRGTRAETDLVGNAHVGELEWGGSHKCIMQPAFITRAIPDGDFLTTEARPIVSEHYDDEPSGMRIQLLQRSCLSKHGVGAIIDGERLEQKAENSGSSKLSRRVVGFIHLAASNHWRHIVSSQLDKMESSGLMEDTEMIYVGIVGGNSEIVAEVELLSAKIRVISSNLGLEAFEFPTLVALQEFCEDFEGDVWYIHSKGAVNLRDDQYLCRARMEDFVIFKHRIAREKLVNGYVAAGAFGDPSVNWTFPGNFWWVRSDYVRALPSLAVFDFRNRWNAERWIGSGGFDSFYFHDCGDRMFRNFRIVSSHTAAGLVTTNGFHGWMRREIPLPSDWKQEIAISAHAPCEIVLEVIRPVAVRGFMAGTSELGPWVVKFGVGDSQLGDLRRGNQRTREARLAVGTHLLRCEVVEGEHWGAHSCWSIRMDDLEEDASPGHADATIASALSGTPEPRDGAEPRSCENGLDVALPTHQPDLHTWEWHRQRSLQREAARRTPAPLSCFYHIACMGNWREVVEEQMISLKPHSIVPLAFVLGSDEDVEWVKNQGIEVIGNDGNLELYETPTLEQAWHWAKANHDGAVLYLHTKGVSNPGDPNKVAWRRLMMMALVDRVHENLCFLDRFDMVGVDWQNSPSFPHYSGNFWIARSDWLNSLDSPTAHCRSQNITIGGHPWRRMHAEMWVGSRPWHSVKSLVCEDVTLWEGPEVFEILKDFERYAQPFGVNPV